MKTALLFGASGLSGSALLDALIADDRYSEVKIFIRQPIASTHPKVRIVITDFNHLESVAHDIKGDVVFSCLGTTLSKAGSQSAQQLIDRDYPIAIAKLAAANGVRQFVGVSSVGTNATTTNFYLKTKFEMEVGVSVYFDKRAIFMRPSFLLGQRKEMRLGEKVGIVLARLFSPLLLGSFKKYRGMPVTILAKAMANSIFTTVNNATPEYEAILSLINFK
jgi:uncharacterized protein YbjT (DUF2867 family)